MPSLGVGLGARAPHLEQIATEQPTAAQPTAFNWLEVHPENYMRGEESQSRLAALREVYPLSLHGVGMSLVSSERLCPAHLTALKNLITQFDPALVSEHLAWSQWNGQFYNDLLPVPMSEEALTLAVERVNEAQDFLGTRLLIENPSLYGVLPESTISEPEFLRILAERTGCGLLLDVNNVFVSAHNLGFDPHRWLDDFAGELIGEIHLGGHQVVEFEGRSFRIDDHGATICEEVWGLLSSVLTRWGAKPVLIERDKNIPSLSELCLEAARAQSLLDS